MMKSKKLLNISEACELLGYKRSYIYKLTSAKIIPHSKPNGKKIFFELEKLEDWALSNSKTTLSDHKMLAATFTSSLKINSTKKKNSK